MTSEPIGLSPHRTHVLRSELARRYAWHMEKLDSADPGTTEWGYNYAAERTLADALGLLDRLIESEAADR
jgi:hypothetical protein